MVITCCILLQRIKFFFSGVLFFIWSLIGIQDSTSSPGSVLVRRSLQQISLYIWSFGASVQLDIYLFGDLGGTAIKTSISFVIISNILAGRALALGAQYPLGIQDQNVAIWDRRSKYNSSRGKLTIYKFFFPNCTQEVSLSLTSQTYCLVYLPQKSTGIRISSHLVVPQMTIPNAESFFPHSPLFRGVYSIPFLFRPTGFIMSSACLVGDSDRQADLPRNLRVSDPPKSVPTMWVNTYSGATTWLG